MATALRVRVSLALLLLMVVLTGCKEEPAVLACPSGAPQPTPETSRLVLEYRFSTVEINGVYRTTYQIQTREPATCTLLSVDGQPNTLFTKATGDAVFTTLFVATQPNPRAYIFDVACTATCGNGVYENASVQGAEGTSSSVPGFCPQDCGCPAGMLYGTLGEQTTCHIICKETTVTFEGESFTTQGCVSSLGSFTSAQEQLLCETGVCGTCQPGTYFDERGACTKVHYRDGICRLDAGEPASSPDCS